ncbi:MAG: restriction endonuclease subunit S [Candidatus Electrothrix sp.]
MGGEWQEARLTDLYDISSGLSKPAKYFGSGYPFLAFKDVFNNYFVPDDLTQLVRSSEKEQKKCSVRRGDVFLTRTSETMHELGMSSVALKDYDRATFNGFTKRLRPKDCSELVPEYIGYYLRSQKFRNEMLAFSTMSTRASLNNEMISHLRISFPSISEQEAIAWVLKSLDDKIQLNRQMNTTLEAMAQALFKSWFVDFDPVIDKALAAGNPIPESLHKRAEARRALGDKRKPLPADIAQYFPDHFVFNEKVGWMPERWEVGKFADIARHVRSSVKADEVEGYDFYVGLEHIGKKNLFLYNNGSGASVSSNKSGFEKGDLLFGKLRPYFHKVCIAPCQGICSTDILVLRAKSSSLHSYMMLTAFTEKFVDYANLRSTGTRMPRANVKDMLEYAITLPSKKILDSFDGSLAPMWKKGMASVKNGQNLATLRDTLLPKLLSGQLRIPDAEKKMNDA